MINERLIIIAGMSRGGTNLLWNIVQSHPAVIDSYYEVNEIFGRKCNISNYDKFFIEFNALSNSNIFDTRDLISSKFRLFAKYSFDNDEYNRQKAPSSLYNDHEFSDLTIATKLVSAWESDVARMVLKRNDALKYLPQLNHAYPDSKILFLIRNGLAVAEGWGRRGADIETAAHWYRKYVLFYEQYVKENPNPATIIRFEDLLEDPFTCAHKIFSFLSLPSVSEMPLRIAIKPTIRSNHEVVNTTEKSKVWINKDNFREFLDVGINDAQIDKLDNDKKKLFIELNRDLLERYRYI
jgi:hypothetical protein